MNLIDKKLFLFDIDGTISLGENFLPGGKEILNFIKEKNKRYIFVTNNSTKSTQDYIKKFKRMGLETEEYNFVTAASIAIKYMQKYNGKKIFVIGTESFINELLNNNINVTQKYQNDVACVLVGFDNELTYKKIEIACHLLYKTNIDFVATNPDLACPTEFGFVPDCGAICQMITSAVKKTPVFLGKPERFILDTCIEITGCKKEDIIIIGDRLYTDILFGKNNCVDTAAVLTGETNITEINNSIYKPDFVFKTVYEMFNKMI